MNQRQKEAIQQLRREGQSYNKISDILGISVNTIKSYCQRNKLGGVTLPLADSVIGRLCKKCAAPLKQTQGKKMKQYCSDQCRMAWWNAHPESITHKSVRRFTCQHCGRIFEAYGTKVRKYCSRACYGKSKVVNHG